MKKISILILTILIALGITNCTNTDSGEVGADRKQAFLVTAEQMEQASKQAYDEVIAEAKKNGTLNTNAATTTRVKKIAQNLINQVGVFREDALKWDWEVNVITDKTVNAWCMAGGKIVVYTGIIDTLNLTDAQLAAVMGHEIAHALKEHSREQASTQTLQSLGISVVSGILGLGDTSQTLINALAQYTLTLKFSRNHETEADNMGTELMAHAAYDPNEAIKIWEKMSQLGGASVPELLSTHPSDEHRIENLRDNIVPKVLPIYEKAKNN